MKTLFYGLVATLLLHAHAVQAAQLRGRVSETSGESLPYATISVEGSHLGTTANAEGYYQLDLPAGEYRVSCQVIGYERKTLATRIGEDGTTVTLDFVLKDEGALMREVVVRANSEDPAYAMIRAAIKKRPEHLRQLQSFQSTVYLKGVMRMRSLPNNVFGIKLNDENKDDLKEDMGLDSNGRGVLYLCEQFADYYAAASGKKRTIIHKVRESGSPRGLGMATLPPGMTFYENNVRTWAGVAPRGFVSPIADGALNFYRYRLRGLIVEGDHRIAKIEVIPKRLYEPLLAGFIYLVEDDWAIHSLSLAASTKNGIEVLDSVRFDQVFVPLAKDTWVVKSQVIYPVISLFGFGIAGSFVTNYSNQQVNVPVPDSIFSGRIISSYVRGANEKDSAFWENSRPLALEADEKRDYKRKDSLYTIYNNPARLDTIRRRGNRITAGKILLGGLHYNSTGYKTTWSTAGLINVLNYNTVEGLNLAPKFYYQRRLDSQSALKVNAAVRYGFANTHLNAIADVSYIRSNPEWRGRKHTIGLTGGQYVFQLNPENPVPPLLNTVSSLLYRQNFLKIYERRELSLHYERNWGNGLSWNAYASYQLRQPLENASNYDWAKSDRPRYSANLPQELQPFGFERHAAAIVRVGVRWQPGVRYIQYPDYKSPVGSSWPVLGISYEKGIPGIGDSKTDFDKWRVELSDDFRLGLAGSVSLQVAAGGFLNDRYASLPDLKHLNGNEYFIAAPYLRSFQLAPYYRFSNSAPLYGEAHLEYNLQGLLTNKIPLLRQAQWYFILGANAFYANEKLGYGEAFVSVDNLGYKLYRFLRLDLVAGRDGMRRDYYGIRIGLRLMGLVSIGSGGAKDSNWQ